jgi:serine/threonine-protein kinase HipA
MHRHSHPSVLRADLKELYARMVFNVLVSNDDDHLRNHGFLRDKRLGGWRLSPLYDVVPRPSLAFERHQHLRIGTLGKVATLDNALSGHAAFDLNRSEALSIMEGMWRQVRNWREHFEADGLPG